MLPADSIERCGFKKAYRKPVIVAVGEVLWNVLPAGRRLGGAAANFAWHAAQLGARGILVSAVGNDEAGRDLIAHLCALGSDTQHIAVLPEHPTDMVSVDLDANGLPVYRLMENVAWDFAPLTAAALDLAREADAVCVGSFTQRSAVAREAVQGFLDATRPECLRIFDINIRQDYRNADVIERTLGKCRVLKLNEEEWPTLAQLFKLPKAPEIGLPLLRDRFSMRLIALTLGASGSLLCSREGLSICESNRVTVADTVGAGDAFTAAVALGLLRDDPIGELQEHATDVASYVCTQTGPTPVLPRSLAEVKKI
jgi:fructokinase